MKQFIVQACFTLPDNFEGTMGDAFQQLAQHIHEEAPAGGKIDTPHAHDVVCSHPALCAAHVEAISQGRKSVIYYHTQQIDRTTGQVTVVSKKETR